jgi:Carboxypeptidase regulatory-like domain
MKLRALSFAFAVGVVLALPVLAQARPLSLRGVVFDSLRGQPMRDAFVSIAGRADVITTDAHGRFQFDSVAPGPHEVMAQHPILDSIGLSGLSAHATVSEASNEVKLAVPSFATLWRAACGNGVVPKDSGIVYGTIRDAARGTPVANAVVELKWSDLVLDQTRHVRERRWRIETRSNELGGYAACAVSPDLGLEIHAALDKRETGRIQLQPLTGRVQRRDLVVGAALARDVSETGTVSGSAIDPSGQPLADVRVIVDSLPEVRTRDDGTFTVPLVPPGTRQIRVLIVGSAATAVAVDVMPGSTANVIVTVPKITGLAPLETRAERNTRLFAAEFNERRRRGYGYVRDSTEIINYDEFLNVFRSVPSMNVQYRRSNLTITVPNGVGGSCTPRVLIDGAEAAFGHLIDLLPKEVAAVEVYVRGAQIPARFTQVGIQPQCGIILVWTKYGMRNR